MLRKMRCFVFIAYIMLVLSNRASAVNVEFSDDIDAGCYDRSYPVIKCEYTFFTQQEVIGAFLEDAIDVNTVDTTRNIGGNTKESFRIEGKDKRINIRKGYIQMTTDYSNKLFTIYSLNSLRVKKEDMKELDFMPSNNAQNICKQLMEKLGFVLDEEPYIMRAFTTSELIELYYSQKEEIAKYEKEFKDGMEKVEECYIFWYKVNVEGLNCDTESFDSALSSCYIPGCNAIFIVTQSGVEFMTSTKLPKVIEVGKDQNILSLDDAKQIVRNKFSMIKGIEDLLCTNIELAYVKTPVVGSSIENECILKPSWIFKFDDMNVCRIDAITGYEII